MQKAHEKAMQSGRMETAPVEGAGLAVAGPVNPDTEETQQAPAADGEDGESSGLIVDSDENING